MYQMLRERNEWVSKQAVDFAQKLVRTPSSSLQEADAADLIERKMRDIGFDTVMRDAAGNVVGVMLGREGKSSLLLCSHMDTVAPADADWSASPYAGDIRDGRLIGAGASDCKGGLAAQLYAADLLKRCLLPLRDHLVVATTTAEENGLSVGLRTLLSKTLGDLEIEPTYAILGEPTDLGLYYGHEGWVELEISVDGANVFQVEDAMQAIAREVTGQGAQTDGHGHRNLRVSSPETGQRDGFPRGRLCVGRRLAANEHAEQIVSQIKHTASLVTQSAGVLDAAVNVAVLEQPQTLYTGTTMVVRKAVSAWTTDPFHPLMERARQSLTAAGCHALPGRWALDRLGMGTAGGLLVNEFGIPTIGYGPGEEAQAHAADESVDVAKVREAVYGTAAIAHSLIGVPVFGWTSDEI